MRRGLYISASAHGLVILWVLLGGVFNWHRDEAFVQLSDVSIISEAEFAALSAPKGEAARDVQAPPAPEPAPAAAPEPEPEPAPAPEPEPAPTPEPEPVPEPTPEPDPTPEPEVETAPPAPAPRVAPTPAPAPDAPAPDAPEVVQAPTPSPEPAPEPQPEDVTPSAPLEATTQIVTEAETPVEIPSAAPATSTRPKARPSRLAPVEVAKPANPANPAAAVAAAVADQVAAGQADRPALDLPEGPPMTRGEKEGLRVAVSRCWNLGSSSTDAMSTTVVVLVTMSREGKPERVELTDWDGPSKAAADTAFQAARRAVIRCGARGFDLPAEKYGQWRQIEMTFNPEKMRIR